MIEIKLPCDIGTRIKSEEEGYELRIVGYKIAKSSNPSISPYIVIAEAVSVYNENNNFLLSVIMACFQMDGKYLGIKSIRVKVI